MRMGFIGAGKLGFTLGKYLKENGVDVSGYYSRSQASAEAACLFTNTKLYSSAEDLVKDSDVLFLTVPDGEILRVWDSIKTFSLTGKCICHTSGASSSAVFTHIKEAGAFGYSIHPLFAISSKWESYKELSKAYFTIEGDEKYLGFFKELFESFGNPVRMIDADNKVRYHAAAVFASNLAVGLFDMSAELLVSCGFDKEGALKALAPLFLNNAVSTANKGPVDALTGPVERADEETVLHHLEALNENEKEVYVRLSEQLVKVAKDKNPEREYGNLTRILDRYGQKKGMETNEKHSVDL